MVNISIAIAVTFGNNDKWSLFIASLGSFGTIATLIVAYKIFITYNAPGDIQKKRFELVDKALAFFITKRFFVTTDGEHTYFSYFTKQRLDYCLNGLQKDNLNTQLVIISGDLLEFLMDFQNQLEHHYFPYQLKAHILYNLPHGLTMLTDKNFQEKIRLNFSDDSEEYGYPMMPNGFGDISSFINSMNDIRIAMVEYLNNKVPRKYQIIDEHI